MGMRSVSAERRSTFRNVRRGKGTRFGELGQNGVSAVARTRKTEIVSPVAAVYKKGSRFATTANAAEKTAQETAKKKESADKFAKMKIHMAIGRTGQSAR